MTGAIEYVITLSQDEKQPVNLRCVGKIVRLERTANGHDEAIQHYHVAATLERYEFVRTEAVRRAPAPAPLPVQPA